jgi:hypothetical protein
MNAGPLQQDAMLGPRSQSSKWNLLRCVCLLPVVLPRQAVYSSSTNASPIIPYALN